MIQKADTKTSLHTDHLFGEVIPAKSRVGTMEYGKPSQGYNFELSTSVGDWGVTLLLTLWELTRMHLKIVFMRDGRGEYLWAPMRKGCSFFFLCLCICCAESNIIVDKWGGAESKRQSAVKLV